MWYKDLNLENILKQNYLDIYNSTEKTVHFSEYAPVLKMSIKIDYIFLSQNDN